MVPTVTIDKFEETLPSICDRETTYDYNDWVPDNPLWAHCAIISLLAHNIFGGKVIRGKINLKGRKDPVTHYWNILPDGKLKDFSSPQFKNCQPRLPDGRNITNDVSFLRLKRSKRFKLLAFRFARALNPENSLFSDEIYKQCFFAALSSGCQKLYVGCVVTNVRHGGSIIYADCNKPIGPLKHLCTPRCIRFNIASRTESMIGACGHSEEFAIWEMVKRRVPLDECDLYIAGVHTNGLPWIKNQAEHTCLRCSVQIYNARVKTVYVPVVDHWEGITAEECVKTAVAYATKEKSI